MPAVNTPSHEPIALEKVKEGLRMARAGMARWEKKGDPTDREILLQIYNEVSVFVEEMETRLGLATGDELPDD
mgnify:CR=1 FL=1